MLASFIGVSVSKRVLLVSISALLGVLSFPPIGFNFLAAIAWLPLLVALKGASVKASTRLGVLHGLLFYGGALSWLTEVFVASPLMIIPLVFIMASFTGLFGLLFSYTGRLYREKWVVPVLGAVMWTGIEFYRCELFILKFPWMTPGVGLGPTALTPTIGVYGMSFLIILAGSLLTANRFRKWGCGVLLLIIGTLVLWGTDAESGEKVKILALQSENGFLEGYLEMIDGCEEQVDIILFPEYAFARDVRKSAHTWKALTKLAEDRDVIVVVGTRTEFEDYWHNTALTLTGDGELGVHYKNHPVHFFDDGRPGVEAKAQDAKGLKFGTSICFDNDYEGVVRRMTADGATFFAIPSLDAESWTEREHWQHAELFRHRAAENGRWMVVAAGSGVTQLIDAHGKRRKWLKPMEPGWMVAELPVRTTQTIYSQYGWLFAWVMLVISGAWIVHIIVRAVHILYSRSGKLS